MIAINDLREPLFCAAEDGGHDCLERPRHTDDHRCHCLHTWPTEETPVTDFQPGVISELDLLGNPIEPNVLTIRPGDVVLVPKPVGRPAALVELLGGDRCLVVCEGLTAPWIVRAAPPADDPDA